MNKKSLLKAETHQGISQFLEDNKLEWSTFPPLADAIAELVTQLTKAKNYRQILLDDSKGATETKKTISIKIKTNTEIIYSALTAYANAEKDNVLSNKLKSQWNKFYSSSTGMELHDNSQFILTMAEDLKTELVVYKVTPTLLDDTLKLIVLFESRIAMPRTVIKSHKTTGKYLRACNKEIDSIFKYRIDKLIKVIAQDSPEFTDNYFAMRPLLKSKGKKKTNLKNQNKINPIPPAGDTAS